MTDCCLVAVSCYVFLYTEKKFFFVFIFLAEIFKAWLVEDTAGENWLAQQPQVKNTERERETGWTDGVADEQTDLAKEPGYFWLKEFEKGIWNQSSGYICIHVKLDGLSYNIQQSW